MKAEIVELDAICLTCVRKVGPYSESPSQAWGKIMKFAYSNKLMSKDVRRVGISHDDPAVTEPERIRYDACIDIDVNVENEAELHNATIPGGKFAKFIHKGSYDLFAQSYAWIFNEWLPESGYQLSDRPAFEVYLNKDPRRTRPENLTTENYIPLE